MAMTVTNLQYGNEGYKTKNRCIATFDTSYDTGGEILTAAQLGLNIIEDVSFEDSQGYAFDSLVQDGGASVLIKAYYDSGETPAGTIASGFTGTPDTISPTAALDAAPTFTGSTLTADSINFIDADNADTSGTRLYAVVKDEVMEEAFLCSENSTGSTAVLDTTGGLRTFVAYKPIDEHEVLVTYSADPVSATGVLLYAVWNGTGITCHLEAANTNDANSSFTCNDGGDTVPVIDNDNVVNIGIPIYFDSDGTDGERFLINSPIERDLYFQTSTGRWIKLTHVADPTTDGVAVYFDDDAANTYQRLLSVNTTTADAVNTNDSATAWSRVTDEQLVEIYFDEDATNGERLIHQATSEVNFRISISFLDSTAGNTIRLFNVVYSATASTDGVVPYFYSDGAAEDERVLFISPTDTSSTNLLDANNSYYGRVAVGTNDTPTITVTGAAYTPAGTVASTFTGTPGANAAFGEVTSTTDMSGVSINITATGY